MNTRVRFIEHKGRRILYLDLSKLQGDDPVAFEAIEAARLIVSQQPREKRVLFICDSTGSTVTPRTMEAMTSLAKHNTPWILASSVVGVTPILRLFLRIITFTAGRKVAVFRRLDDAKEWLVAQKEPPTVIPQEYVETEL